MTKPQESRVASDPHVSQRSMVQTKARTSKSLPSRRSKVHVARYNRSKKNTRWSFSKKNPDEEAKVREAQERIMEARMRETGLVNTLVSWISSALGLAETYQNQPTRILDHVFLGNSDNAADHAQLIGLGITHICNCAVQTPNFFEGEFVYLHIKIEDSVTEDMMPHFEMAANFLRRVEEVHGRVLVHCVSGISRSAALVVGYLMSEKRMSLWDSYSLVRRRRKIVFPNKTFRLQLAQHELALRGQSSVASTPDKDWNFYEWNEIKSELDASGRKIPPKGASSCRGVYLC